MYLLLTCLSPSLVNLFLRLNAENRDCHRCGRTQALAAVFGMSSNIYHPPEYRRTMDFLYRYI